MKTLTPVQDKLYKMFKWFHEFCEDNKIRYYAVGGTVLGAIRHKGFIPWDDDIDIVIPREDYNRLINTFTKPINGYLLESPYSRNGDYLYSYAKLYDTSTTLTERTRRNCRRGLYIDVFPLDAIGDSKEVAIRNFRKFDNKNMFLMMRTCAVRKERKWYKNLSIYLARMIPNLLINEKKLSVDLDKLANSFDVGGDCYVANLNGTYRDKEIIEKRVFGNPTLYTFEDIKIYGPQYYDEYLTKIYGEWRKLPPKDKQKTAHDYIELNLNKSYLLN